ncbi:hypothetical protein [Bacillus sp. SBS7]|uniref:hypothetical protein n=1 Tax=Bacillus sp. SBS7 TaxID=3401756 RepID=UPI003AA92A09
MAVEYIVCEWCGEEVKKRTGQRFCKYECHWESMRMTEQVCINPFCEKKFRPQRKQLFCSMKCSIAVKTFNEKRECIICQKVFIVMTSKQKNKKYCSSECAKKSSKKQRLLEERKGICQNNNCKNEFTKKRIDSKYCSRKCSDDTNKRNRRIEDIALSKENLFRLYIIEEYGTPTIAKLLGYSKKTILRRLEEYGIERRKGYDFPELNETFLLENYIEKRLSTRGCATIIGCSNKLVGKRLKLYKISVRDRIADFSLEERKEKYGKKGPNHNLWKGGLTEAATLVRNRTNYLIKERLKLDNYCCMICSSRQGTKHVHHIIPLSSILAQIRDEHPDLNIFSSDEEKFKFVEIASNDPRVLELDNLITLCPECHADVHTNNKPNGVFKVTGKRQNRIAYTKDKSVSIQLSLNIFLKREL